MSVTALIKKGALLKNLSKLREVFGSSELMLIVKANGYGHGVLEVSEAAIESGIKALGALEISTAIELRKRFPKAELLLLAWQFNEFDPIDQAARENIHLGVGNFTQFRLLEASHSRTGLAIQVHLKIDTGLNRNGVNFADWPKFIDRAVALEEAGVIKVISVWSHLAEKSDVDDDIARGLFLRALKHAAIKFDRKLMTHLAASSASFRRIDFRFDMVRNGGHVYGIPSIDGVAASSMGLVPVMTLVSEVTSCRSTDSNQFEVKISAGYLHGIPGYVANKVHLAINGNRFLITRVEDESLTALGDTFAKVGERVFLFGDGSNGEQTVREWADAIGTLGDEICCRISPAVKRELV
jgi:alanine racemase